MDGSYVERKDERKKKDKLIDKLIELEKKMKGKESQPKEKEKAEV